MKMDTTKQTMSGPHVVLPQGWTDEHTAFVKKRAHDNEETLSILIMFEAEYPRLLGVTEDVIRSVW